MEEHRKAVRAMQVYIREQITEEITPADLAKASGFSRMYFSTPVTNCPGHLR